MSYISVIIDQHKQMGHGGIRKALLPHSFRIVPANVANRQKAERGVGERFDERGSGVTTSSFVYVSFASEAIQIDGTALPAGYQQSQLFYQSFL